MDPDATLADIRQEIAKTTDTLDAVRLAELIESLDYWLTTGGFLPESWRPSRTAEELYDHSLAKEDARIPDVILALEKSGEEARNE